MDESEGVKVCARLSFVNILLLFFCWCDWVANLRLRFYVLGVVSYLVAFLFPFVFYFFRPLRLPNLRLSDIPKTASHRGGGPSLTGAILCTGGLYFPPL